MQRLLGNFGEQSRTRNIPRTPDGSKTRGPDPPKSCVLLGNEHALFPRRAGWRVLLLAAASAQQQAALPSPLSGPASKATIQGNCSYLMKMLSRHDYLASCWSKQELPKFGYKQRLHMRQSISHAVKRAGNSSLSVYLIAVVQMDDFGRWNS